MDRQNQIHIEALIKKGIQIPNPQSVTIGGDVDLGRISGDKVLLHTGCKILGASTLISAGAILGHEGPVTVENCWIGPQVELKSGYFKGSVFLKKASVGLGAHFRNGTILEEEANSAHTVGLKQTILFPFVTLGSLINFCDCFMAGGTSRRDHSEVGSSYVHFNYTPNQDKATPSLIGDVPRGVMLDQRPIFLGGQGGLVGPSRLAYGTIVAAGTIYRKDELRPGQLLFEGNGKGGNLPFVFGVYRTVKRLVKNNVIYIANLYALMQWYWYVRSQFIGSDFPEQLFQGLLGTLDIAIDERIKRLKQLSEKMPYSISAYKKIAKAGASEKLLLQKQQIFEKWPDIEASLAALKGYQGKIAIRDSFLASVSDRIQSDESDYIATIKSLTETQKAEGTAWLQGIVDHVTGTVMNHLPAFEYRIGS